MDTLYHVLATIAQVGFWVYVPLSFLAVGWYAGERHERGRHRDTKPYDKHTEETMRMVTMVRKP